ncbi:MAG: amino acid transporter [Planctomycetota bacterium]|nr:amino acid transporter [Planctomycetota bacterium]
MTDHARGFSLRTATFLVVSSTVGGGVLSTSGYVALDVGSNRLMLLLWVIGGVIAACGALSLAEVSASLPRSGGEFVILSEAYGPLIGFLGGWVSLIFGFVAPIAATGSAAASYLLSPCGMTGLLPIRNLATIAIVGFALTHAAGRAHTERVQGLVTAGTIAALSAFVVAGIWVASPGLASITDRPPVLRFPGAAMFVGLIFVSYAYTGWNGASYVAGEIADSQRILPLSILLGTGMVVALYIGLNAVFALAVPIEELRMMADREGRDSIERIAAIAARRLFNPPGANAVSLGLGVVLLASLSAMLLTGPRVAVAMAREGRMPSFLGRNSRRNETPATATALVAAGAIVLLWSGRFEAIVFAAGVGLALNSLLTVAAVYVLRWSQPDLPRPFRVPGYPVLPAIYLVLTAASLGFAFVDREQRLTSLAGLAGVVAGIPVYFLGRRGKPPERPGSSDL